MLKLSPQEFQLLQNRINLQRRAKALQQQNAPQNQPQTNPGLTTKQQLQQMAAVSQLQQIQPKLTTSSSVAGKQQPVTTRTVGGKHPASGGMDGTQVTTASTGPSGGSKIIYHQDHLSIFVIDYFLAFLFKIIFRHLC